MARDYAPYKERAELKQSSTLSSNQKHIITFDIKITEGFEGFWETFFQIHNYNNFNTKLQPSIMLGWSKDIIDITLGQNEGDGKLFLFLPNRNGYDSIKFYNYLSIAEFKNKWHKIKVEMSKIQGTQGTINLSIDGEEIANNINIYFPLEGTPHIKYGIYRPGNTTVPNKKSVIYFNDIHIKSTN